MNLCKSFLFASLALGFSVAANASKPPANPIKVSRVATYLSPSVGSTEIRKCPWDAHMIEAIVDEADGRVEITSENLAKVPGRTLSIVVMSAQANGNDRSEFPSWVHLRGELRDGQQLVATFSAKTEPTLSRRKISACKAITSLSTRLAEEIADWTKKPKDAQLGYKEYN